MKNIRLYWWVFLSFFQKHTRLLIAIMTIVLVGSVFLRWVLFSQWSRTFSLQYRTAGTVGIIGAYQLYNMPEPIMARLSQKLVYEDVDGLYKSDFILWEAQENSSVWIVTIREGAVFSDGVPLESKDIPFEHPEVTVVRPDKRTIIFSLARPYYSFPRFLQKRIFQFEHNRGLGLGMYTLGKYTFTKSQDRLTSVELLQQATRSNIHYRFYQNDEDIILAYKLGEITDLIGTKKMADALAQFRNTHIQSLHTYNDIVGVLVNMNNPLLKERDVREALYQAIPFESLRSYGERARGPVSPHTAGFDQDVVPLPENPDVARSIMQKYATTPASLRLYAPYDLMPVASLIRNAFNASHMKVRVYTARFDAQDFDLALFQWKIPEIYDQYYLWHSSQIGQKNITGYTNPRIDKILEEVRATDAAGLKQKLTGDFQKRMVDDTAGLFLYYPHEYLIQRKK